MQSRRSRESPRNNFVTFGTKRHICDECGTVSERTPEYEDCSSCLQPSVSHNIFAAANQVPPSCPSTSPIRPPTFSPEDQYTMIMDIHTDSQRDSKLAPAEDPKKSETLNNYRQAFIENDNEILKNSQSCQTNFQSQLLTSENDIYEFQIKSSFRSKKTKRNL